MAILPEFTDLTRGYWEAAAEGRLVAQCCRSCDAVQHPPMPRCAQCHSAELGWRQLGGDGTVYAYTVVTHPTHAALADRVPYAVGLVELDEGLRLVTDFPDPEQVRVGMRVQVTFVPAGGGVVLPHFVPAAPGAGTRSEPESLEEPA